MSTSSEDNDSGAEEATLNGDELNGGQVTPTQTSNENGTAPAGGRIAELLQEEREGASTPPQLGNGVNRYKAIRQIETHSEDGSLDALPRRADSPVDSMLSVPDDSPSVQVGQAETRLFHY
jgi:vacuolar protein sorting-associated protein 8